MMNNSLTYIRDLIHAQFCYQMFITPIHLPLEKKYRDFANMACEFMEGKQTEVIQQETPRHYVIHRFTPANTLNTKKILITHGWISRAAYMVRLIKILHKEGYDVYALDFPAHGESKGLQLPWPDAVAIIRDVLNQHGPFYGVIGHSFGGSMLLNAINLAGQLPQYQLNNKPERAILMASPTRMRSPVNSIAKRFRLTGNGYLALRELIRQQAAIDPKLIHLNHFIAQKPEIPFLCIHGEMDTTIDPRESIVFCNAYKNAQLSLLPEADHVSVLMDERVERLVYDFLS